MKTEKMSLVGVRKVLSRAELKEIMAGSGGCDNTCNSNCPCNDSRDWCDNGLCKDRP